MQRFSKDRQPTKRRGPGRSVADVIAGAIASPPSRTTYLSNKVKRFLRFYEESGFEHAEEAATKAGYYKPSVVVGKLLRKYSHLIEAARIRSAMARQMEIEEALKILGECARKHEHPRHDVYLKMVLQVHQLLSEKGPTPQDRRLLSQQVSELVASVKTKLESGSVGKAGKMRLKAMLGQTAADGSQAAASIEASFGDDESSSSPTDEPSRPQLLAPRAEPSSDSE